MTTREFHFEPTFERLEALLSLYKKATEEKTPGRIELSVDASKYKQKMSAGFPEEEVWLSLDYALELMGRDHSAGCSQVEVRLGLR